MAKGFFIKTEQIKEFEADLKKYSKTAHTYATKFTLNDAAFDTRLQAQSIIKKDMVLRTPFTVRSVQYEKVRTNTVSQMRSVVGSIAPYMDEQEFGGVKKSGGRVGVPIPTSEAANQGEAQPRTKLPTPANRLRKIKLATTKRRAKNHKQAQVFKVQDAVKTGKRKIFFDTGKKEGIFKVVGGKKSFKKGWPEGARIRMLYDMTESFVRIPKNPWLAEAIQGTEITMPSLYIKNLKIQGRRAGIKAFR